MPWSKVDGSEVDACNDGQVAVVKDGDGSVEGCHDTEDEADDQLAALNASEERADASDLSEGDYVEWDSSGGTAYGQVDNVAMGETVSGSLEPDDTEHETSEDNPGVIIELVERGDDGEVMGTGDTVFHRPDELRQINKSDVPEDRSQRDLEGRSYRAVLPETNIRQTADGNFTVQFMTEQVARDGMVLDADGLDTRAFEQNPVVLWSHGTDPRRGDEPIAKASNIRRNGDGMLADVTFAEDEFAQRIREKVENGFVNAVSVGWRTEDIDRSGDAPTVTRSDMTEFSFVAVPADTDALVQERTAGSDVEQKVHQLESQLEDLRAQATATSPQSESTDEGTPSSADDERRDDAQQRTRYVRLSDVQELREQRKQEKRKIIRTELKKLLGMA
jgi:HK97 family phage prohead protease